MNLFLGIDTSAYTTSVALVNEACEIIADERIMLKVEDGERGLRQSEAHFSHIRNLPFLFERISAHLTDNRIASVGVSDRPRRLTDSYMPVFTAGQSVAQCIASVLGFPLRTFSHQEGHVMAAIGVSAVERQEFIAIHFSGGTSEILAVKADDFRFDIDIIMGSRDLNAGQLVDRVGVAMGLPFPSGPHLERMARDGESELTIPSVVTQQGLSFSGAETRALGMLDNGVPAETVAFLVLRCIANTLEKAIRLANEKTGLKTVVLAGGVMANSLIRERLNQRFEGSGLALFWSPVKLSSDNAVGTAMLALRQYKAEQF